MIDQLPSVQKFPDSAPRYPNLWFLVSEKLLRSYRFDRSKPVGTRDALRFMAKALETTIEMEASRDYVNIAEGSDSVAYRRGLAAVDMGEKTHDHAIHVRFYLAPVQREVYVIDGERYFPACASVHFEVDKPGRLHPYMDDCPVCGCVGQYAQYFDPDHINQSTNTKNEMHHDPLGVEAILFGTVQGKPVALLNSVDKLASAFDMEIKLYGKDQLREDMNTGNLAVVLFRDVKNA